MEKMIGVINNSLRNIINGIKTHKSDAEKNLAVIKADMDEKVAIAAQYKVNVEDARTIISSLENEITDLEKDLRDLNEKFGSKNFTEILAAGNKEINTKIIEKRAGISEQNQRILDLTEKAHVLKEELVKLKTRKVNVEEALNKSIILENYYELRINEIIKYAEENPGSLDSYEVEEEKQITELTVNDFDVEELHVDGSVFEEIDELSTLEIDEDDIQYVMDNIDEEEEEEVEETPGYVDLTMTQQLDDIILAANNIIAKEQESKNVVKEVEVVEDNEVKVVEVTEEVIDETDGKSEIVEEDEGNQDDGGFKLEPSDEVVPEEEIEHIIVEDDLELQEIDGADLFVEKPEVINNEIEVKEAVIPEENDKPLNIATNVFNESIFNVESTNFYDLLSDCNLDHDRFNEEDLIKLEGKFNKEVIIEFVNVLKKHDIAISKIYDNVDVMLEVTPQNMDHILTLLKKTGATNEAIGYVFNILNKVNINALEVAVNNDGGRELAHILFDVVAYEGECNILNRLGLNAKEEADLRRYSTLEEFKMMNLVPEIVLANYETLKGLRIDNLNECITKHPKRFLFNPDRFSAILDKYDTDDLIRCINKNSAVIDKL